MNMLRIIDKVRKRVGTYRVKCTHHLGNYIYEKSCQCYNIHYPINVYITWCAVEKVFVLYYNSKLTILVEHD